MKLIAGLGNPGKTHVNSRHNIGFSVVKKLSRIYKISLKKEKDTFSLSGKGKIDNQSVVCAMPTTFMNLSGISVKALLKKYKVGLEDLLVVLDDLDLELGRIRIKAHGSAGGHHGLKSVIDSLRSENFCRLRIGIGRPNKEVDTKEFVLSPFAKQEKDKVNMVIEKASNCCRIWVTEGVSKCMNIFNTRAKP